MPGSLPPSGLRVLDVASFIAGPVTTAAMSDYGAEVIRIESRLARAIRSATRPGALNSQHPVNFCWHLVNRKKGRSCSTSSTKSVVAFRAER